MEQTVSRRTDPDRFEITVDGQVAGFTVFSDADGRRTFPHTEISPEFGGRGLASALVGEALAATRRDGLRIVAVCSFVRTYLERHPEFEDLVDEAPDDLIE